MTCIAPGQVQPEDLLAYLDGEAGAAVADHVARCATCAAQAAAYADVERGLRERLFRADCPAVQALADLAFGLLSPEEEAAVRAHLALCPHCAGELAHLETLLKDDPLVAAAPAPSWPRRIMARLLTPMGQAAVAGVRGAGGGGLVYEAGGLTVSLTAEADGSGPGRRWLLLVLVVDEAGDTPAVGATLRLLNAGTVTAEVAADDLGTATFEQVEAGTYDLELHFADLVVVVEAIVVGAPPV